MALGLQGAPYRIPEKWDPAWFTRFIREVLANADTRNAEEGPGITITGQPDQPATISASDDLQNLLLQSFVLATPSGFLEFERVLTGEAGIVEIIDGGADSTITVGLQTGGVPINKLIDVPALSVLGNQIDDPGPVSIITGSAEHDVLSIQSDGAGGLFTQFGTITHQSISDFDEAAQDAVGGILTNTSSITLTYNDAAPSVSAAIVDEYVQDLVGAMFVDSSEINFTYSDPGGTVTADLIDASITFARLQNIATSRILGRITGSSGSIESLTGTQATTLLDVFTRTLKGLVPPSGGTTGTTNFLREDGTWAVPPGTGGGGTGANPTASVGLTAVNGVATTFLRSDGAPALSQAIAPTWTGAHQWGSLATRSVTMDTNGITSRWDDNLVHEGISLRNLGITAANQGQMLAFRFGNDNVNSFDAGAIQGLTEADWSTAANRDSSLVFYTAANGNNVEAFRAASTRALTAALNVQALSYRSTGADVTGWTGAGTEVHFSSGSGALLSYNRTSAAYQPLSIGSASLSLDIAGSPAVVIDSNRHLYGTALHNNASLPTGTTNQYVASGTYTPTLTIVANAVSTTNYATNWIRVGNVVTVGGVLSFVAGSGGLTRIGISLPLGSSLASGNQVGGAGGSENVAAAAAIVGDATNDRAELRVALTGAATTDYWFTFTYLIL